MSCQSTDGLSLSPARQRLIGAILQRMAELRITTRRQLADLTGCHESTISRLLSGNEYLVRLGLLHALERTLQLPSGYLAVIHNGVDPQGLSMPLPSLSLGQALAALRVRRYPLANGLASALSGWEPVLTAKIWGDWEAGRSWPDQQELQATAGMLQLNLFERGWLFGLSGVPVEWATLEEGTRKTLQAEVDAWPYGPAIAVGQPFLTFLTVNGQGCDLVNVPRDPRVIEYVVGGQELSMDATPFISNGRTFVPVYLADAFGATSGWMATTQTVTITSGSNTVILTVGSTVLITNGMMSQMDVAPMIVNGRTYLLARYIAEAFGYSVSWDAGTQTVNIVGPEK